MRPSERGEMPNYKRVIPRTPIVVRQGISRIYFNDAGLMVIEYASGAIETLDTTTGQYAFTELDGMQANSSLTNDHNGGTAAGHTTAPITDINGGGA